MLSDLTDTQKKLKVANKDLDMAKHQLISANERVAVMEQEHEVTKRKLRNLQEMKGPVEGVEGEEFRVHSQSVISGVSSVVMEAPDWSIASDDVVYDNRVEASISSSTGHYFTGEYLGCKVSVKPLLKKLPEDKYMKMVHQIHQLHHSNLLLFLGAVKGVNPVIIYELLPSKPLNILLEESPLPRTSIIRISTDVCHAMVYLHHKTPPIIHGLISSRVIFVESSRGELGLIAKLGDVGLYPSYCSTIPAYTSPDTCATPKIDVYAFGVLLIEMCCRKALVSSHSERDKQVQHINWVPMVGIIKNCLDYEPDYRHSMKQILTALKELS